MTTTCEKQNPFRDYYPQKEHFKGLETYIQRVNADKYEHPQRKAYRQNLQKMYFFQTGLGGEVGSKVTLQSDDKDKKSYLRPMNCTKTRILDVNMEMSPMKFKELQDYVGRDVEIPNVDMLQHLHMSSNRDMMRKFGDLYERA